MDWIFWERSVSLSAILKIVDLLSADVESILRMNQYLEKSTSRQDNQQESTWRIQQR